jgi:hypothetical protein
LAEALDGFAAGLAGADNDDASDFAHAHSVLVFGAAAKRAQAALDARAPSGQHSRPWPPKPSLIRGKLCSPTPPQRLRWVRGLARSFSEAMSCA